MGATLRKAGPDGLLDARTLQEVVELLRAGEPVALPTETVYGLAANALDTEACTKIFAAKRRPFFDPLICHLPSLDWFDKMAEPDPAVRTLTECFWPGALTLVLPKRPLVPDLVTSGLPDVALRMSAHPVFQQIAAAADFPLAAPSANRFGRISPTTAQHVIEELGGDIPMVVDGGPCSLGVESTIVRVRDGRASILRPGPIPPGEIARFLPLETSADSPMVPGACKDHYAPRTPLQLLEPGGVTARLPESRALLAWTGEAEGPWQRVAFLSQTRDLHEAARNFYRLLRELDASGVKLICAEPLPNEGLGATLMDRLRKAAHE